MGPPTLAISHSFHFYYRFRFDSGQLLVRSWQLSLGGAIATAVAFGPARMGFGLFVPTLAGQFSIDTAAVGLIESSAFAAFLAALLATAYLVKAFGPRLPVLAGCFSAA